MNKIKLFIVAVILFLTCASFAKVEAKVHVGNNDGESVYTLSEAIYDEETGKVAYQKISYSKNTYKTTSSTEIDANGNSVDVSNDAEYVFIPARYLTFTNDTQVSFKYKNNGVKKILLHAEYAAGVSQGGVDYKAGYTLVCINAIDTSSWNVTKSKSADGYDVASIKFGSYVSKIYDVNLVGFRLYFDYGENVNSYREFEIYGCEVHEPDVTPTFASDPKPTRLGKITSDDVEIKDNAFKVSGEATVSAKILDYTLDNEQLAINFTSTEIVSIDFKLDGKTVAVKQFGTGKNSINLTLSKDDYSNFEMVVSSTNAVVTIQSIEFLAKPYVDTFSGSSSISFKNENGIQTITYSYKTGWYKISAPIRKYNDSYDFFAIEVELSHPIVMGILFDETYVRDHWKYTEPLAAGTHTFLFDISDLDLDDSSTLNFYLDPAITNYSGIDGTKVVKFTKLEFIKSEEMPDATITVDSLFEFNYDGKGKTASGASTNSGANIYYEYKLEGTSDDLYDTTAPVEAGRYDVRVVSPSTDEYAKTYAYTKLVINKAYVSKPTVDAITIDYTASKVYYDESVYSVSRNAEFTDVLANGGYITYNTTLYFRFIEGKNYHESEATSITLNKQEEKFYASINYLRERTVEIIPTNVEYSTDGLNWISGEDKRVTLEAGKIYIFRTKATNTSFASENTYLAVNYRVKLDAQLELESTNSTSITLVKIEGVEYRLDDTVWQDSNVFTGLKEGSKVIVYMRMKGTETAYASEEVSIEVTVGKMSEPTPPVDEPTPPTDNPTPPVEEPSDETNNDDEEDGCGGSILASFIGVTLLASAVIVYKKRKEDE